jgi:magnesium-transporting ATPase (P-type)
MDREVNESKVLCWRNGKFEDVMWQDVAVGDVLKV